MGHRTRRGQVETPADEQFRAPGDPDQLDGADRGIARSTWRHGAHLGSREPPPLRDAPIDQLSGGENDSMGGGNDATTSLARLSLHCERPKILEMLGNRAVGSLILYSEPLSHN